MSVINSDEIEKDVFEFFYVFSRFEFALKEAGYICTPRKTSDNAMPYWDGFVKDYKDKYKPDININDSVKYLLSNPPQKQKVYDDGQGHLKTTWGDFNIDTNAPALKTLTDIVKTIRNNLFHGGKYGNKGWDNQERVSLLLKHSSTVLKEWLSLKEEIEVYYNDFA